MASETAEDQTTTAHLARHGIEGGIRALLPSYATTPGIYDPRISYHSLDTALALVTRSTATLDMGLTGRGSCNAIWNSRR